VQNVVVVGMGASGTDIALEVSHVAKEVHIASRYSEDRLEKVGLCKNVWIHTEVLNSELSSSRTPSPSIKLTKSSLY
jgi:thioredoxin reductase